MLKIALTANSEGVFGWGVKIMLKIAFTATLRVCLAWGGGGGIFTHGAHPWKIFP